MFGGRGGGVDLTCFVASPLRLSLSSSPVVLQISEMMKTYLNVSGLGVTTEQVNQLCQQLERSSTREEVDAVNTLLADFTSLTIKKDTEPG